ncbi:MAG TPA: hypothetical protein PK165_02415 [bacterium]|nr:hypothetical protein [bacterium]
MRKQWWESPQRMMRRDYLGDFSKFLDADMEKLARETKTLWRANCEWIMATPGCAPGTGYLVTFNSEKFEKLQGLEKRDLLREYVPIAKKHKLHIIAYINMHWYSYEFAKKNPGWEQLCKDGIPYGQKHPLYGNGTTFCVNSPWRDWAFEMIQEVMKTGVDGCFLDGPVVYPEACYCRHCQKKFHEFSGENRMPDFCDWKDPLWKKFAIFRSQSWAEFMKDASNAAKQINENAVMFLNGGHFSASNIMLGYDAGRMEQFQTFTGAEDFFHCTDLYRSPYTSLNLSRFLSAGKNPSVVFTHHTLSTWHYVPLPEAELSTALAQATAGGSNTWFAIFYPAIEKTKKYATGGLKTTGSLIQMAEKYIAKSKSCAEAGVMISNRTLYFYISSHRGLCYQTGSGREQGLIMDVGKEGQTADINEMRKISEEILNNENHGCLDLCNFAHIPVRVIWDEYLDEKHLSEIKLLILPNTACLSEYHIRSIMNFVHNGGVLLSDFESGMYDSEGNNVLRKHWLDFLGIKQICGVFRPSRIEEYMMLTENIGNIERDVLIPRPMNALAIHPTEDARVLAKFLNPINLTYRQPQGISNYPALIVTERGKGSVVYFPSAMFESFNRFHIDFHKKLVHSLIKMFISGGLQIETDAPGSLAIELRKNEKFQILHLVNVTSDMKRPMDRIIPLHDIFVSVKTDRKKALSLSSGKSLPATFQKGKLSFTVPLIKEYEMILLS